MAGVIAALSLSFSGNLIRLTATYVITCVQKPTDPHGPLLPLPQFILRLSLLLLSFLPSFALSTYVLQEEGN